MFLFFGNRGGGQWGQRRPGGHGASHNRNQTFDPSQQRIRTPRPGELYGLVMELHGGSRMTVQCEDSKVRMCRIPGKIRSKLWIKPGDIVIIVPWSVESDAKGDIAYRYTAVQVDVLKRKGLLRLKLD